MRIVIETDERASTSAMTQPATGPTDASPATATNAGPPSAALLRAVGGAAAAEPAQTTYRDGMDGGGPSLELVKAVQSAPSMESVDGASGMNTNGGAAPSS